MKSRSAELSSRATIHRGAHRKNVSGVAFNSDGTHLAVSGDCNHTVIFDVEQNAPFHVAKQQSNECQGHSKNIEVVVWHPTDPKSFATAGSDKIMNAYDLRTGAMPTRTFRADGECLNMGWAPDGRSILVSDRNDNFYKIDTRQWELEKGISFGGGEINEFQWSARGDRLYLPRANGRVSVLRWPSLESIITLDAHTEHCQAVAVDSGDIFVAICSDDTTVSVWDARSLANLFVVDRSEYGIRLAAYSHDASILAFSDDNSGIQMTDALTGNFLCGISTSAAVNCLHWHPKQQLLVYSLERLDPRNGRGSPPDASPNFNVWGYAQV